jgi:hypothetical protein
LSGKSLTLKAAIRVVVGGQSKVGEPGALSDIIKNIYVISNTSVLKWVLLLGQFHFFAGIGFAHVQ